MLSTGDDTSATFFQWVQTVDPLCTLVGCVALITTFTFNIFMYCIGFSFCTKDFLVSYTIFTHPSKIQLQASVMTPLQPFHILLSSFQLVNLLCREMNKRSLHSKSWWDSNGSTTLTLQSSYVQRLKHQIAYSSHNSWPCQIQARQKITCWLWLATV